MKFKVVLGDTLSSLSSYLFKYHTAKKKSVKVQTLFCFELSFLLKTGFKLISICFKLTSAMVMNILKGLISKN